MPVCQAPPATLEQPFDELVERLIERAEQGEQLDLAAILRLHPQHAEPLRAMWPAIEAMFLVAQSNATRLPSAEVPLHLAADGVGPPATRFGDYEILSEIGRGGMGIVYRARQLSLGREVALKILPFAALADDRQIKRFKNEARAAGTLEHPNIVSVFSVGTDRGVHYYAMRLIDGQNLAQWLARLRQTQVASTSDDTWQGNAEADYCSRIGNNSAALRYDIRAVASPATYGRLVFAEKNRQRRCRQGFETAEDTVPDVSSRVYFRRVARLGIQAARALDHAHQHGIVHRDIKPGNLLVNDEGQLWVTDFGLAHIENDASSTMTSDILGTLRYSSPEQVQTPQTVVDYRTDIYSLGATLYEMLTLQPACRGSDRQALLSQIVESDPIRPHKINPAVPRDLVTIVRKAMEKRHQDRYRRAGEVADDLTRYLEDRPILAQAPTPTAWVQKWMRRHRGFMAAAVLLLVLGGIGLAVSNVMLARERAEKNAALQAVEANLSRALDASDRFLAKVSVARDASTELQLLQRDMAGEALELCEVLLQGDSRDPRTSRRMALLGEAFEDYGGLHAIVGRHEEALRWESHAVTMLESVLQQDETNEQVQQLLIAALGSRAVSLTNLNRHQESVQDLRRSIELNRAFVEANPTSTFRQQQLVRTHHDLAHALEGAGEARLGKSKERAILQQWQAALDAHRQTPADHPLYALRDASNLMCFGDFHDRQGRKPESQTIYRHAMALFRNMPESTHQQALRRSILANVLVRLGGEDNLRKAMELREQLVAQSYRIWDERKRLVQDLDGLAQVLLSDSRLAEAEQLARRAVQISEQFARPNVRTWEETQRLASCHATLGQILHKQARVAESVDAYRQAITLQTEVMRRWPSAWECYQLLTYYREVSELPLADVETHEQEQWPCEWLAAYHEFHGFLDRRNPDDPRVSQPYWRDMIQSATEN